MPLNNFGWDFNPLLSFALSVSLRTYLVTLIPIPRIVNIYLFIFLLVKNCREFDSFLFQLVVVQLWGGGGNNRKNATIINLRRTKTIMICISLPTRE